MKILDRCKQITDTESGRVLLYRDEVEAVLTAGDTISRQVAIKKRSPQERLIIAKTLIESVLDDLPSAQPEPHWIPCSERLPEVYKDVLICWDFKGNREVLIGNMYSDGTFHGYDDEYLTHNGRKYRKAVAWMPLPEPYKAERREE